MKVTYLEPSKWIKLELSFQLKCKKCNTPVASEDDYCSHCGRKLDKLPSGIRIREVCELLNRHYSDLQSKKQAKKDNNQ